MGGTAVSETPRSSETLRAEFQKLLKALRPDDTRSDYRSLASRLADLAVEVLGTNQGAKGTKKSEQEAQLVADVLALKEAFVELFQRPADSRAQGLADLRSRLGSASEALSRGQKALDASGSRAAARFRALDEMLMILSNHAQHISGEPSTAE